MFFGATPFASTTFAGVGIQNVVVLPNGNRLNISIGNAGTFIEASVTGNRLNLANGSVSVISWQNLNPGAGQTWIPIDPLNP